MLNTAGVASEADCGLLVTVPLVQLRLTLTLAVLLFARRRGIPPLALSDMFLPVVPIGLGRPLTALNIVGFPLGVMPPEILTDILRGGNENFIDVDAFTVGFVIGPLQGLFLQIRHDRCVNCNACSIADACPSRAIRREILPSALLSA